MADVPLPPTATVAGDPCQLRTMTLRIVRGVDWNRRQQVVSLSSECLTQSMSQEFTIVGSINILSSRYRVVQYHSVNVICINEHIVWAFSFAPHFKPPHKTTE
ncbi:hypothetical protein AVEN_52978-1 [Araneus ventricosus]|uniref:Uncharacterized protein n=1 Tax=Araneus ventricosus TaxID=182803 RepID=A0A4Y2J9N4_ARAVE|nr:hypothetical protein AVEN_52978-1 [Araneus ventricosus]